MRGDERVQDSMFSYLRLEQRVPADHPLREIRTLTDGVLQSLDAELDKLYAATGRASIAPEYVLRALLLQAFYSIRSERQLVEQIDYFLVFRLLVGVDDTDLAAELSRHGDSDVDGLGFHSRFDAGKTCRDRLNSDGDFLQRQCHAAVAFGLGFG